MRASPAKSFAVLAGAACAWDGLGMERATLAAILGVFLTGCPLDSGLEEEVSEAHWAGFSKVQETCVDHSSHDVHGSGVSVTAGF